MPERASRYTSIGKRQTALQANIAPYSLNIATLRVAALLGCVKRVLVRFERRDRQFGASLRRNL